MTQAAPSLLDTDTEASTSDLDRVCIMPRVAAGLSGDSRPIVVVDTDDVAAKALIQTGIDAGRIHLKVTEPTAARKLYPAGNSAASVSMPAPSTRSCTPLRTRFGDNTASRCLARERRDGSRTIAALVPPCPAHRPPPERTGPMAVTVADQRGNRALNNAENTRKSSANASPGASTFDRIQTALRERHGRPYP